jgi:3-oxoacyl-[acyl-carrier protein] reductase
LDLEDKIAVVTGSTRGLGEEMARRLFADGACVVVAGRNVERAHAIADELDPGRERALGLALDVASRESFTALVDTTMRRWGRIDILVNNAGTTATTPFLELDDAEWDDVLATNLRSVFIGLQLVGPIMRRQQYGRIINHASIAGQQGGTVTGPHYAAAKAGIIVLTKIVARELAAYGVTVNTIAPAAIAGPVMDELPVDASKLPQMIPVGRVGSASEVAAAVSFLASSEAGYITGATLDINGGLFMR